MFAWRCGRADPHGMAICLPSLLFDVSCKRTGRVPGEKLEIVSEQRLPAWLNVHAVSSLTNPKACKGVPERPI